MREQANREIRNSSMQPAAHSPTAFYDKPPIPPRGVPPPVPQRQSSVDKLDVQIRQKNGNSGKIRAALKLHGLKMYL